MAKVQNFLLILCLVLFSSLTMIMSKKLNSSCGRNGGIQLTCSGDQSGHYPTKCCYRDEREREPQGCKRYNGQCYY
jgi:hypothetical protein